MIQLFTDVSLGLFGRTRGGPAKVAVFASGMMGTISGSGVANVVTVGQFTIPLMIKFGYRRAFAAGVEATASMGGQIMPPVMGAVAFIMAETLGVDYSVIVKAAVIPADALFRLRVLDGASGSRQARPRRHEAVGDSERLEGAGRRAGISCCRWPRWSTCCSRVLRRSMPAAWACALTVALILGASITLGLLQSACCATSSGSGWRWSSPRCRATASRSCRSPASSAG